MSPLSHDQYRAVMGYIKNIHNHSLDKIKPQGQFLPIQFIVLTVCLVHATVVLVLYNSCLEVSRAKN